MAPFLAARPWISQELYTSQSIIMARMAACTWVSNVITPALIHRTGQLRWICHGAKQKGLCALYVQASYLVLCAIYPGFLASNCLDLNVAFLCSCQNCHWLFTSYKQACMSNNLANQCTGIYFPIATDTFGGFAFLTHWYIVNTCQWFDLVIVS